MVVGGGHGVEFQILSKLSPRSRNKCWRSDIDMVKITNNRIQSVTIWWPLQCYHVPPSTHSTTHTQISSATTAYYLHSSVASKACKRTGWIGRHRTTSVTNFTVYSCLMIPRIGVCGLVCLHWVNWTAVLCYPLSCFLCVHPQAWKFHL